MLRTLLVAAGLLVSPLIVADAQEWRVNPETFSPKQTPRLAATATGKPYVAYGDDAGRLLVRHPDASIQTLTAPDAKAAGFVLEAFGENLYAAWLNGQPGAPPAIEIRGLHGDAGWSDSVALDSASRPLPRIRLTGDAEGQLSVVWLGDAPDVDGVASGESAPEATPNYHLYARRSKDGGQRWGDVQRLTAGYDTGFWPALTMAGGRAHVFADARRGGETLLVHAQSDDALGWTPAEPVKPIGSVLLIAATEVRGEPLAVWFGGYGNQYRLESAVRDGDGWKTYAFPGSDIYDIGSMDLKAQGDYVYLVFSARGARQTDQPRKNHVFFTRSTDGGVSWEPIRPFRHYPFDITQDNFPQIALGRDGSVLVAWNDYRNLRGDLYYNRSTDHGATWLAQDLPLDAPGVAEDVLFPFVSNLRPSDTGFWQLAARYRDDGLATADLYLHALPSEPPAAPETGLNDLGSAEKKARLELRAAEFWGALVKADYASAFALFDPYFRRRMREGDYVGQSGRVKHHSFSVQDARVAGNLARVAVEFNYEIPLLKLPRGGTYSRPPTSTRVEETWIYIDGDWFKEYRNEIGDFSYTRY
ncbi:sialidase family protein [Thiocystis violacea]|uniref:sialidase family protein n=1 Tax=Thiocystis violacea TaxID=13725 RepID=UPI001906CCE2|nr:sialidase family protein [Thiocystis violacea]MBK1721391.1 hypothetical protein [Thiocystis violacea]